MSKNELIKLIDEFWKNQKRIILLEHELNLSALSEINSRLDKIKELKEG